MRDIEEQDLGPTCPICGWGDTVGWNESPYCNRHKPEAIARWLEEEPLGWDDRVQICMMTAAVRGLEDYEQHQCDTGPAGPNFKCPGCPFHPGWMFTK